jgi:hypothetical protein
MGQTAAHVARILGNPARRTRHCLTTLDDSQRQSNSARWLALALVPALLADAAFVVAFCISLSPPVTQLLSAISRALLYGAFFSPVVYPFYLYPVGRACVREVHGGFRGALPFMLIYGAANLGLWACGVALIGSQINWAGH